VVSVEEESRSELNPLKRGSPLPWLLLGITLAVGVTMAIISHQRLVDEKTRTARALQANDEVMGRLRSVVAENQRLREDTDAWKAKQADLEAREKSMEDQLKTSADEIARCKSKGPMRR
jgi:hypothetical protein